MDGQQVNHHPSLQHQLNRWILTTTFVFVVIAAILSGAITFFEARELQDDILQEIASLVRVNHLSENTIPTSDESILIQRLGPDNTKISNKLDDGLQTITIDDDDWRVYVLTQSSTHQRFAVGQQTELRDEIAWNSTLNVFWPIVSLVVILLLIINVFIRQAFKPLKQLATLLDKHDGTQLSALPETNMLKEIVPFLLSINGLLARSQQTMKKQQRFIADAAHELRTPVTALSLLSENIKQATTEEDREQRQLLLQQGFERLRLLVAQLLDLARLQSDYESHDEIVSFNEIVQNAIADLYPLAEGKNIDLGMSRQEKLTVLDKGAGLSHLVRNAIDNAIRYTPTGGTINVSLFSEEGNAIFCVEDTGKGIPEAELQLIFEPFYRAHENMQPGNGLGLTISLEVARKLGGHITLSNRSEGGVQFRYLQRIIQAGKAK
tara:strand:- start:129346 stop:130653 length:1308 start_codon:yes stop_codon:yes gene_type:complete